MLAFGNSVTFAAGKVPVVVLRNFWEPESGFVWSTGKWCEICFPFDLGTRPADGAAEIILDLDVFKVDDKMPGQNVLVYLNGLRIGSLYCTSRTTAAFGFDSQILAKDANILTFDTPDSARPSDFGVNDNRSLGVQIFSMRVRKPL
jgi:hypothetical protein